MYIEMTTFAVPAFLVTGLKFAALFAMAWVVLMVVGVAIYTWSNK